MECGEIDNNVDERRILEGSKHISGAILCAFLGPVKYNGQ